MDNMKDIITDVIGKLSQRQSFNNDKIQRLWCNILNTQEVQHTQLMGIKEGILSVNVDSPAWLYQMNIKRSKILERLKTEDMNIKSIFFRIGKVK